MSDMPFVRGESELPYIRTLCDVLKHSSAGQSFENILLAKAVSRIWNEQGLV